MQHLYLGEYSAEVEIKDKVLNNNKIKIIIITSTTITTTTIIIEILMIC